MKQSPIETQFSQLNTQYLDEVENVITKIEKELVDTLKKKYPKYSQTLPSSYLNEVKIFKYRIYLNRSILFHGILIGYALKPYRGITQKVLVSYTIKYLKYFDSEEFVLT